MMSDVIRLYGLFLRHQPGPGRDRADRLSVRGGVCDPGSTEVGVGPHHPAVLAGRRDRLFRRRPPADPPGRAWRPGAGFPEPERPRPVAPDNPEFLRNLDTNRRDDERLFRNWEADLRRREEELKRREGESGPSS
jgi:hypothetical protein